MILYREKLQSHIEAVGKLEKIIDRAFKLLEGESRITEYELKEFILGQYKREGLVTDCGNCIVAFRQNTSYVHYLPSQYCLKIKPESLILIDVWARLKKRGSVYADLTRMAYKGEKLPGEIQVVFEAVRKARDAVIKKIKHDLSQKKLPLGKEVDRVARNIISEQGFEGKFKHALGHSLGYAGPHGTLKGLSPKSRNRLKVDLPYTIEPGIYLDKKFGVRSEIDFYISTDYEIVLTSKVPGKIKIIS